MLKPPPAFVTNIGAWEYTLSKLDLLEREKPKPDKPRLDQYGNPLNYAAACAIYKNVCNKYAAFGVPNMNLPEIEETHNNVSDLDEAYPVGKEFFCDDMIVQGARLRRPRTLRRAGRERIPESARQGARRRSRGREPQSHRPSRDRGQPEPLLPVGGRMTDDGITRLICETIAAGDVDGDLVLIQNTLNMRKTIVNGEKIFRVGQRVEFNDHIIPKYLKGGMSVVQKVNDKTVIITVEHNPRLRKWSGLQKVRAYKNTLDIID